jgi:hypothetical protein
MGCPRVPGLSLDCPLSASGQRQAVGSQVHALPACFLPYSLNSWERTMYTNRVLHDLVTLQGRRLGVMLLMVPSCLMGLF